jgi:hypothetical protein
MTRNFVKKNRAVILQAIAEATQAHVAEQIEGKEPSFVSRFLKNDAKISFDEMIQMLDAADLIVMREIENHVVISEKKYKAMVVFCKEYAESM